MGQPPYGYMKDSENPKRWIVDEEAAQIVRRIYSMTLEGLGTEKIATRLSEEHILTPMAYWLQKGVKRPGRVKQRGPYMWNSSTITKILSLQEYCGDILNFKTYSKSYKNKRRLENDRENWVIFKDAHEPIVERAVFEQVREKRGKIRKRRTNEGEPLHLIDTATRSFGTMHPFFVGGQEYEVFKFSGCLLCESFQSHSDASVCLPHNVLCPKWQKIQRRSTAKRNAMATHRGWETWNEWAD